ncbi:MAG: hypothetical protein M0006_08235 [Magnetospirillum sp.]|nr:hypothetical protein [Magnetospirillum sp.]
MTAPLPAPSLSAAFPGHSFTPRQRDILARIWNGADLRAWQVHHTSLLSLMAKGVVDCEGVTCRLSLVLPEQRDQLRASLLADIARLDAEVEDILAGAALSERAWTQAALRVEAEAHNVAQLAKAHGDRAARDLAIARSALDAARADLRQITAADERRARRLDIASADLRDARRRLARLDMASTRRKEAA